MYRKTTGEREFYRFPPLDLIFVSGIFKERNIIHPLITVPLPFFAYVNRPHVECAAREQSINNRRMTGDNRNIMLRTLSSEYDGYGLHYLILPYAYRSGQSF